MFCKQCGAELPVGGGLCARCGSAAETGGAETGKAVSAPRSSALGLSSLILSILALVVAFGIHDVWGLATSILFGALAIGGGLLRAWRRRDEFAIAGLVLGAIAFLFSVVVLTAALASGDL